jgi:hypothetical protein
VKRGDLPLRIKDRIDQHQMLTSAAGGREMRIAIVIPMETSIVSVVSGIYQASMLTWKGDNMLKPLLMGGQAICE